MRSGNSGNNNDSFTNSMQQVAGYGLTALFTLCSIFFVGSALGLTPLYAIGAVVCFVVAGGGALYTYHRCKNSSSSRANQQQQGARIIGGNVVQPLNLNQNDEVLLKSAFFKIYKALRDGQNSWFKSNKSPASFENAEAIASYSRDYPNSRTAKAFEIARTNNNFRNMRPENVGLFSAVYQWAYAKSNSCFKRSKVINQTAEQIAAAPENTRTGAIRKALTQR